MIPVDFDVVEDRITELSIKTEKLAPAPVLFYNYIKRVLRERYEKEQPVFPREIKIPKSNASLLKGDFEPDYVIRLESPLMLDSETPMWYASSAKEIMLRLGYTNLDARNICNLPMNMEYIHGFLGGTSGHGKSVTLNSIIGALCHEYAPWELELHLSDAKVMEFMRYGIGYRIPHIKTIAATEDADFVISVLEKAFVEMNQRAKIFGNIGVSNLKNFREKTGLAYPRVLIMMDEVESTFRLAGKKSGKIADLIDGYARLGRAAGYHIMLATQNMSSEIPSSAVGQIRIRLCLGANEKTSTAVLGNSGAMENVGRIGRLIANTEVMAGGNTSAHNTKFQTPYITDDNFVEVTRSLESFGRDVGYKSKLSYYNENDMKLIGEFDSIIDKAMSRMGSENEITEHMHPICLGFPAFVTEDKDELLKVWLEYNDIENFALLSGSSDRLRVLIHLISYNLSANGFVLQHFMSDVGMEGAVHKPSVELEARNTEQAPLNKITSLVKKRLFLLTIEGMATNATFNREAVEALFDELKIPGEDWGNSLLCKRATVYQSILSNPASKKEWEDILYMFPSFSELYNEYRKSNSLIKLLSRSDFIKAAFFIGDLSKIIGYGRDTKTRAIANLKRVMQDASRVGVIFVVYSRMMEGINELNTAVRYTIFDSPDSKDWGRMRAEEPVSLSNKLAVLYDNQNSELAQRKFKRTLLKEEY